MALATPSKNRSGGIPRTVHCVSLLERSVLSVYLPTVDQNRGPAFMHAILIRPIDTYSFLPFGPGLTKCAEFTLFQGRGWLIYKV
jgi:hypothetical protein